MSRTSLNSKGPVLMELAVCRSPPCSWCRCSKDRSWSGGADSVTLAASWGGSICSETCVRRRKNTAGRGKKTKSVWGLEGRPAWFAGGELGKEIEAGTGPGGGLTVARAVARFVEGSDWASFKFSGSHWLPCGLRNGKVVITCAIDECY